MALGLIALLAVIGGIVGLVVVLVNRRGEAGGEAGVEGTPASPPECTVAGDCTPNECFASIACTDDECVYSAPVARGTPCGGGGQQCDGSGVCSTVIRLMSGINLPNQNAAFRAALMMWEETKPGVIVEVSQILNFTAEVDPRITAGTVDVIVSGATVELLQRVGDFVPLTQAINDTVEAEWQPDPSGLVEVDGVCYGAPVSGDIANVMFKNEQRIAQLGLPAFETWSELLTFLTAAADIGQPGLCASANLFQPGALGIIPSMVHNQRVLQSTNRTYYYDTFVDYDKAFTGTPIITALGEVAALYNGSSSGTDFVFNRADMFSDFVGQSALDLAGGDCLVAIYPSFFVSLFPSYVNFAPGGIFADILPSDTSNEAGIVGVTHAVAVNMTANVEELIIHMVGAEFAERVASVARVLPGDFSGWLTGNVNVDLGQWNLLEQQFNLMLRQLDVNAPIGADVMPAAASFQYMTGVSEFLETTKDAITVTAEVDALL